MHPLRTVIGTDDKRFEIRYEGVQRYKFRAGGIKGLEMVKILLREAFLVGFRVVAADMRPLGYAAPREFAYSDALQVRHYRHFCISRITLRRL